jgi:hypothetical protein
MTPRFTTLRTMSQYSLARLRVLCSTRTLWSVLSVSSLLVLAVIGTSAARRARTSSDEVLPAEAPFAVSPLAELVQQTTAVPAPQDATTVGTAPPVPLPTTTDASMITQRAETHDRVITTTMGDEQAQPASRPLVHTTPREVTMPERTCTRTERRTASVRSARQTDVNAHPSRPAPRAPMPALPRVQVVSVSSTAVLIQHGDRRQIIRRGVRLNGWTLARLAPTGVTLQRAQHQALLPLSFGSRLSSNR